MRINVIAHQPSLHPASRRSRRSGRRIPKVVHRDRHRMGYKARETSHAEDSNFTVPDRGTRSWISLGVLRETWRYFLQLATSTVARAPSRLRDLSRVGSSSRSQSRSRLLGFARWGSARLARKTGPTRGASTKHSLVRRHRHLQQGCLPPLIRRQDNESSALRCGVTRESRPSGPSKNLAHAGCRQYA